ncbi:MAG: hypothetical protein ACKV19_25205 [Verrucomicrobiales bacterium]
MDLTRFEFSLSRTFNDTWDAVLRVPYFIKDQTAETVFPKGISEQDKAAAIRSGYAHHRTETYEGFSDLELSVGWRKTNLLWEGSVFRFSLGLTIPVGDTEDDPLVAGDAGLEHLHIQFGNGTFDPLIDFYYGLPLNERFAVSLFGRGRFPFYENDQGYQGSVEGTLGPRLTWLPHKRFSFSAGVTASYFGYSEWNATRDPNSGQFALNASLGVGAKITDSITASFNALLPVYTKTFAGEDALDPAPTFSLSAGWTF